MALNIRRIQVWSGEISDRPGAAAGKLANLARAGAELEFIFTRPNPNKSDAGVIFLAPITGSAQMQAARDAGLGPALDVAMLVVEGDQRPGVSYDLMSCLAIAGINLRGISLSSVGKRFVAYLAFDGPDTATMALQVLVKLEK
jgi:hypothetical protein